MTDRIQELLASARQKVPGMDANRALWDLRNALLESFGRATCYEMVLPDDGHDWESLLKTQVPRLIHYLDTKHESIPGGHHVMISVWLGAELYIFDGQVFWQTIGKLEHLPASQIRERLLNRTPLLLGPGPANN